MRIGFYAVMKAPDDLVPSGDRTMARLLMSALELAGHDVELLSRFKCRLKTPDDLVDVQAGAEASVERIAAQWQRDGAPDLVVIYHVYYKSPDMIGAVLARQFNIPYVTVEASYAGKRDRDEWAEAQAISSQVIRDAALNICLTDRDANGLRELVDETRIALLPPFIDTAPWQQNTLETAAGEPVRLVTVAMMPKGNKIRSFNILSQSLKLLNHENWQLTVIGDGSERSEVEALFADEPRVVFAGQKTQEEVASAFAESDVFVWPGYREAFGLAYLEAQAAGLPVVAMKSGGVESVVMDGKTALLANENNVEGYVALLDQMIGDADMRVRMGEAARRFVTEERSLETASQLLNDLLAGVTPS